MTQSNPSLTLWCSWFKKVYTASREKGRAGGFGRERGLAVSSDEILVLPVKQPNRIELFDILELSC